MIAGTEPDLNPGNWTDPIPVTIIDLTNTVAGRYIKFSVDSYWGWSGGLNELRAYESSVPEPGSLLLFGISLLGLVGLRKRKINIS